MDVPGGPGWYSDPLQRAPLRWWDGIRWTDAVNGPLGGGTDPIVAGPDAAEQQHLAYLRQFVQGAVARGVLDPEAAARLDADALARSQVPVLRPPPPVAPFQPVPARAPAPIPARAPIPAPAPSGWAPPTGAPAPAAPVGPVLQRSTAAAWWGRARASITADLAVHGLADLGVLLLFAGLFGFVAFAFGQVRLGLRPVAEAAIPLVLFGAGTFLRHRGTRVVGEALVFLGGLLLPVVAIASLTDGSAVPPDLTGRPLALALAATSGAIGAVFALLVRRRPASSLRFLVAPMGWLAAVALGLLVLPEVPDGRAVAVPEPWPWALGTVAVALSILGCGRRKGPVAEATVQASWVGLPATYLLVVGSAARQGWPAGPLLVAGAAVVVGIDLLLPRQRGWVVPLAQAIPVGVAAVAVGASVAPAIGAGLLALVGLALVEWHARRGTCVDAVWFLVGVAATGVLVAVLVAFAEPEAPWAAVAVGLVAWSWAFVRDRHQVGGLRGWALPAAVVALPLLVAPVAGAAWSPFGTVLALVGALLVGAIVVRWSGERERPLWSVALPVWAWWLLASIVVVEEAQPWAAAVGACLVALVFVLAPRHPAGRSWGVAAALVLVVLYALAAAEAPDEAAAWALLAAGVAVVGGAEARARRPLLGHVVLQGESVVALGVVAALAAWPESAVELTWTIAAAQVAVLVGWTTVALAHEARWSNLTDLFERLVHRLGAKATTARVDAVVGRVPLGLAVVALPVSVASVVAAAGSFGDDLAWPAAAGAASLVLAAAVARASASARRGASLVCAHLGLVGATVLALATVGTRGPIALAGWSLAAFVVVEGPQRRNVGSVVVGLGGSAAGTAAAAALVGVDQPAPAGLVAAVWGAVVVVGALALDERRAGPRARGTLVRSAEAWAGVTAGVAGLGAGILLALEGWPEPAAAALLVAAVAVLAVALLLREPWVSLGWWLLLLAAAAGLASPWMVERPFGWVVASAALLVAADLLHAVAVRIGVPPDRRGRWDAPAFVAAHPAAVGALVASAALGWVTATWLAVAALSTIVALRLRRAPWAIAAVPLAVVAAGAAGPGWLALALAATAGGAFVVALRSRGGLRIGAQVVVAVASAAAWGSVLEWRGVLDAGTWASGTALGGAAVLVAGSVLVRYARVDRSWWVVAAGATSGWVLLAVTVGWPAAAGVGALGVAAVALGLAAAPMRFPPLRDGAAVLGLLAVAELGAEAGLGPTGAAWVAIGVSLVGVLVVVVVSATGRGEAWLRFGWIVLGGALGGAWMAVLAFADGTDRTVLVAALLVTGLECAVLGVVRRVDELVLAAPWWFAAAWLAVTIDQPEVGPVWTSLPVGLAVLVTVALARAQRRASDRPVATPGLVALDWAGMALVAAPPIVDAAGGHLVLALLGVAIGCALAVWGVASRVLRRLLAGVVTVVLSVGVLIVVPLLEYLADERLRHDLPEFRGPVLWLAIAAVGGLAIVAAAFVERGRAIGRNALASIRARTEGWE